MTKQEVLDEVARRVGDESATFKSGPLSKAFDFVLLELAQEDCLSLLRKQSSFALNVAGVTSANGITNISTTAASTLNLGTSEYPTRINRLLVPAWGNPEGWLEKKSDEEFERLWIQYGTSYEGRPRIWRIYPSINQVQLWPKVDSTNLTATLYLEWVDTPTTLADGANITEISVQEIPTVLAGLYRYGLLFQDETMRDLQMAEARWLAGVARMKANIAKQQFEGRPRQIAYKEF